MSWDIEHNESKDALKWCIVILYMSIDLMKIIPNSKCQKRNYPVGSIRSRTRAVARADSLFHRRVTSGRSNTMQCSTLI